MNEVKYLKSDKLKDGIYLGDENEGKTQWEYIDDRLIKELIKETKKTNKLLEDNNDWLKDIWDQQNEIYQIIQKQ